MCDAEEQVFSLCCQTSRVTVAYGDSDMAMATANHNVGRVGWHETHEQQN